MNTIKANLGTNTFSIIDSLSNPDNKEFSADPNVDQTLNIRLLNKTHRRYICRIDIKNKDDSLAKMCGNGLLAIAKYITNQYMTDCSSQPKAIRFIIGNNLLCPIDAYYNKDLDCAKIDIPIIKSERDGVLHKINVLNNHIIQFNKTPQQRIDLSTIEDLSKKYESNVGTVTIINKQKIDLHVWEQGAGETGACGSNACAAIIAGIEEGLLNKFSRLTVDFVDKKGIRNGSSLKLDYHETKVSIFGHPEIS